MSTPIELTNAWAARFTDANIEHVERFAWERQPPDERPDHGAWANGFKAAIAILRPEILKLCADNERLLGIATRTMSLETPTLVFSGSVASDDEMDEPELTS